MSVPEGALHPLDQPLEKEHAMFPPWFLSAAVWGGLLLVAGAAVALASLWLADLRARRLW